MKAVKLVHQRSCGGEKQGSDYSGGEADAGMQDWWSMTPNVDLLVKEVDSTAAFAQSVNSKVIPGSTLILDFPFFHHPVSPALKFAALLA